MREFKCYECNHTWTLQFGEGGRGSEQTCPKCGSRNIHRFGKVRGGGRGGWGFQGRRWDSSQQQDQDKTK